jgi:predicted transcriptional regulator
MKEVDQREAIRLRELGYSINLISERLNVSKSSVSVWVRNVDVPEDKLARLKRNSNSRQTIEKRRTTRLKNEKIKRDLVIEEAKQSIPRIDNLNLWLIGVMLYWAEGGKTQRLVRFSNGDPEMIKIMMEFFRRTCSVPESKFRGYIHIHPQLDFKEAEKYWSDVTDIPLKQFFKTYRIQNKSSKNKKDTLPYGVLDIYVMDTKLFYKINGWAKGIFSSY